MAAGPIIINFRQAHRASSRPIISLVPRPSNAQSELSSSAVVVNDGSSSCSAARPTAGPAGGTNPAGRLHPGVPGLPQPQDLYPQAVEETMVRRRSWWVGSSIKVCISESEWQLNDSEPRMPTVLRQKLLQLSLFYQVRIPPVFFLLSASSLQLIMALMAYLAQLVL